MQEGWCKSRIDLPETLVMEILPKLPVKSLTRFRCVCKPWCSYFQTIHFITKHQQNNLQNNNLNLLLKRGHDNTHNYIHYFSQLSTEKAQNFLVKQNIHLPFFENCCYAPEVSGPCNGLFCLCDYDKLALWNPSTREFKILPQSSVQRPPSADSTRFECFGFGYDSKTDDYKVIRFVTNYFEAEGMLVDTIGQVDLYSLKSDSWKEISVLDPYALAVGVPLFNNYINGFYYWHAVWCSSYDIILSFDMANEKFSILTLPKFGGSFTQYYWELLDFNGSLGVIFYPIEGTEKSFDLWVMNGSWTKQLSIESVSGVERPLGFWKNGEWFLEGSNHELVLFDPTTQELKNLGLHAYPKTMQLIAYVESLAPINGRSELQEHIIRQPVEDASSRY